MNIQEAKEEIIRTVRSYLEKGEDGQYLFPAVHQRPLLLMGPPGIGKTAVLEQAAESCAVNLVSYTLSHHTRQSAIGLPRLVEKHYGGRTVTVTEYTMSEIIASVYDAMERTGTAEGILFLDEINCVSETLAPTMLQFLQNKTFGTHRLPAGWVVVAAGNPPEYNKSVREFDVVTLDRVRQLTVEADLSVWLDYARQRQLHGAVLSYLTVKPDRFYTVTRKDGELSFVTARGWEDLSRLLQSYETHGLPVTEDLIGEYLRKPDTARDFAAYWRLYRKYGTDYGISDLLDGVLTEAQYREKTAMAAAGGFDEGVSVVNLLLEGLAARLRTYETLDARTVRLHEMLKRFRGASQTLPDFLAAGEKALTVKEENGLISKADAQVERWVLGRLAAMGGIAREQRQTGEQLFPCLKAQFAQDVAVRADAVSAVSRGLDNAIRFAEDSFGTRQEMNLLVTGLTKLPAAQEFIRLHGCPAYLRHMSSLLYHKREEALRRACRDAL